MATAMTYDYITIQASHSGITPVIEAKQGDSGRGVIINITDMDLTGMTALAYVKKPDDKKVFNNASINDDGQVVVDFTAQMLAVVGIAILEVEILQGARRVTTFIIKVDVKKSEIDGSAIESTDEFGALETAIANAQTATNEANVAARYATTQGQYAFTAGRGAERATTFANEAATAANNAATAANNAAASANAGATAANEAAASANLAAAVANTASAYIRTEEMPFELANIEAWTSGSTNVLIQKATKTGNIITIDVHGKVTAAMGEWSEAFQIKEAFNALPVSWRKTINDQVFLSTYINGGLCGQAYINGTRDNVGIMTASGGFWSRFRITGNTDTIPAGAEINIHGSWIVDGVINKIESTPIAVMTNALAAPADKIIANIEPVQEGTGEPSPDNVRPISGWDTVEIHSTTNTNLVFFPPLDVYSANGITCTSDSSELTFSGTATANTSSFYNANRVNDYDSMGLGIFPAGEYSITCYGFVGASINDRIIFTAKTVTGATVASSQRISGALNEVADGTGRVVSFTANEPFKMGLWIYINSGTTLNCTAKIAMVRKPNVLDYEKYYGSSYFVYLPTQAGTVYGGILDVTRGVLTVDRGFQKYVGDTSEAWAVGQAIRYSLLLPGVKGSQGRGEVVSNLGVFRASGNQVGTIFTADGRIYYYPPQDITTVEAFKNWLSTNNLEIVYPLATPITYQLTPTEVQLLQGYNTLWADTGDVTVSYLVEGV